MSSAPIVRLAAPSELPQIVRIAADAYLEDPVTNYFGSQRHLPKPGSKAHKNIAHFYKFLIKLSWNSGARVTVVECPDEKGVSAIRAVTVWLPPKIRIEISRIFLLIRSGVLKPLSMWGFKGFKRTTLEHLPISQSTFKTAFKSQHRLNPSFISTPDDSWHLQLAFTDPAWQGKGFLSLLIREAYTNAPEGAPFTLEGSSPKSKDRYEHLGFELIKTPILGKGKVSELGLEVKKSSGEEAKGLPIFVMVNWKGRDREKFVS